MPSAPDTRHGEYADERDLDRFWAEVRPRREPTQKRYFVPVVVALVVLSVPWYWPAGRVGELYHGLPDWIWIAMICTLAVAGVTAFAALRLWDDDQD